MSFGAACEELRACALRVCEARLQRRRARNQVNVLCQKYSVQLKQKVPEEELQKVCDDRAASKKNFENALKALDACLRMVESQSHSKPADWESQVAIALVWPRGDRPNTMT